MRMVVVLVVALSASSAAYAQQTQTLSIFRSDLDESGGVGLSYERMFAPRWSVQAAVAVPDPRFRYRNHLEGAINGGTVFMLTHDLGLMLDGRIYLGSHESYDQSPRTTIGLSWRF